KHFSHPLDRVNPLLLLSVFNVLVLNLLGQVTRRSCNFALCMLKLIIESALRQGGRGTMQEEGLLKSFPTDIRSMCKLFGLDPMVTIFAACPTCSLTYEPTYNTGIPVYP
ncbi:uncharacterized protein LAESUDRAFT_620192, partial [Laetiporus sulphureus 93-53]